MTFALHVLATIGIYSILALGYTLIFRVAGLLSLAYGCYFAIGAYSYALGSLSNSLSLVSIAAVAVTLAAAFSLLESLLSWRLRSDFFFVGTLALQAIIYSLALNWVTVDVHPGSLLNLTNGAFGLPGIPRPATFGIRLDTDGSFLVLVAGIATLAFWVFRNLVSSPWGRMVEMSRDDELSASSLGKSPKIIRLCVLMVGSGFGAIGGALYAAQTGFVDPDVALLSQTISILAMVTTAEFFRSRNPLAGVATLVILPEALRFVRLSSSFAADAQVLAYGLLLVGIAHATRVSATNPERVDES